MENIKKEERLKDELYIRKNLNKKNLISQNIIIENESFLCITKNSSNKKMYLSRKCNSVGYDVYEIVKFRYLKSNNKIEQVLIKSESTYKGKHNLDNIINYIVKEMSKDMFFDELSKCYKGLKKSNFEVLNKYKKILISSGFVVKIIKKNIFDKNDEILFFTLMDSSLIDPDLTLGLIVNGFNVQIISIIYDPKYIGTASFYGFEKIDINVQENFEKYFI